MIGIDSFSDEYYEIVHLTEDVDVSGFVSNKGYGLEVYLKRYALGDELANISRTYLVLDKSTKQIAAYFTLRTGLITVSRGFLKGFDAYTGIELANFAVNDSYREVHEVIPRFGAHIFYQFILPLTLEISKYVGAAYLYIYALPDDRLMAHYETMGFEHTSEKMKRFIYRHVKPVYDEGCMFMWQKIV